MSDHPHSRLEAFARKTDKRGHDECWPWLANKNKSGHGRFRSGGRLVMAHRQSWEFFFGNIPEGKMVLHKCDDPGCVNPYHLYLGSNSDNMKDSVRAGTHNGPQRRSLNEEQLKEAQRLLSFGRSQYSVARILSVSRSTIENVNKGVYSPRVS